MAAKKNNKKEKIDEDEGTLASSDNIVIKADDQVFTGFSLAFVLMLLATTGIRLGEKWFIGSLIPAALYFLYRWNFKEYWYEINFKEGCIYYCQKYFSLVSRKLVAPFEEIECVSVSKLPRITPAGMMVHEVDYLTIKYDYYVVIVNDSGLLSKISGRLEFDEAWNKAKTVANETDLRFFSGKADHKLQVYNSKGEIIVKSIEAGKSEAAIDAMHLYTGLIFKIILALILSGVVWVAGTILLRLIKNAL
ncbi:MAG: hypothetical protein ACQETH_09305 [Candidatus Rifleibacteriota bacterium]